MKGILFNSDKKWWEDEWQDMPEFVQKNLQPFKSIYVHFESKEDMKAFAKLVNQKIGIKTKFIWYPKAKYESILSKRYIDLEEQENES